MRARRIAAAWTVIAVAVLTGCTSPDTTPVPELAVAPFVCSGVQEAGAELILGGAVAAERESGGWSAGSRFGCAITTVSGGDANIQVSAMPPDAAGDWGVDPESILKTLSRQGGAEKLEADAEGGGYTYADGYAGWVCSERFTLVVLDEVQTPGRDRTSDARSLLVSMLPWAWGDVPAPERTEAD